MSIRFGRSGGNYSSSEVMQTENDDWRKIEDVTERRRIQNRLAQRNYRRKLRAKLEELEKKAHSSESSPGPSVLSSARTARSQTAASSDSSSSGPATEGIIASPSSPPYGQQINLSQPVPDSSGPFNFDISLDSFLEGVDDMLGPFPVSIGETPRSVDSPNHPQVNHTTVTPISSYETGFTPRSSTSSGFTPAPFGMPMITSYRPPGYLIPPSFSPPPEERPDSRRTIDTPNSSNLNYSGSGLASDSPNASIDLSAMTPSASSSSSCSDLDSSSDPGEAGTLTGRAVIYRDDYIQALSKLTLPPGFQELVNPKPTPKQQTFLQQLMAPRQHSSIPSDSRFMTLQFNNIFNASILNGIILSFDSVLMLDEDAISPFNDNNQVALSPNIPKDLEPTPMQMAIPHHPYIDIVPFPGFRDRMLRFLDIIDEDDVCCLMHTDWGVWGNRPWDKTSWEVGEKFAEKYWFLMDDEMKKTTDFWRSQRGLKPLRSQQSRKPERGKVVGEV